MEVRKASRAALATLFIAAACISTPASARNGEITRSILLAPLVLPAAIVAATMPPPVVYRETHHYEGPRYYKHRDNRRYQHTPRYERRHYRSEGRQRHYRR